MLLAFILNFSFAVIELIGGIFTSSISVISDSVHDLGDSISIGASFFLEKKSEKPSDSKYTYGYARFSLLGALLNSSILFFSSLLVIFGAITRMISPVPVKHDGMIFLAVLGIIVNGIAAVKTARGMNLNERSLNLHMLEDLFGWLSILVGSIIIKFTGWYIIDPIMSIGIAIFIFFHAISHLREILEIFLEKTPRGIDADRIRSELLETENIKEVTELKIRSLNDDIIHAVLKLEVSNGISIEHIDGIKTSARKILASHAIDESVIEICRED